MVKKIYSFALNPEVIKILEEYRRTWKIIPSRSQAIEYLIRETKGVG